MKRFFGKKKLLIGMIHLRPLPGSPRYDKNIELIRRVALNDMETLIAGGADAFIIENYGDFPFEKGMSEIAFAVMASICEEISNQSTIPFGINVHYNNIIHEWALAFATNADFIRSELFVENRVSIHGISYASAPKLLRLKAKNPCNAMIFADINSKHSFPLVEQPLNYTINSALENGADALILTGVKTGTPPTLEEAKKFKNYCNDIPLFIGSGINEENIASFLDVCDGVIVGSSIKKEGYVHNPIDINKIKNLSRILNK